MKKLHPNVPAKCQVYGFLYDSDDPEELSQDMLDVELPNGILVSTGWEPEGDAGGAYVVRATHSFTILHSHRFKKMEQAAQHVEETVRDLLQQSTRSGGLGNKTGLRNNTM